MKEAVGFIFGCICFLLGVSSLVSLLTGGPSDPYFTYANSGEELGGMIARFVMPPLYFFGFYKLILAKKKK